MKRFYFLLALMSFALNTFADEWTDENGVTWSYEVSGDKIIIQTASPAEGDLVCPNTIDGKTIISIGSYAFNNCKSLTSITIPNGVTSIGYQAFASCSNLKSITIPNGVSSIGYEAFYNISPQEIIINYSTPNVWSDQFGNLPSNCPRHIYQNGEEITELILSEGLASLPNYAFYKCSSLTSITLPENITSIGSYTFSGCSSLTSIDLPGGVTSIGGYAFQLCNKLTNIYIPEGLTSIGNYAFYGCLRLESITLPESLISIGNNAFNSCKSLTSITLPEGIKSIANNTFYGCSGLTLISMPGVANIESSVFSGCTSLSSVVFSDNLASIGTYAFKGCTELTSIALSDNLTSLGSYAFQDCSNLTSITIPNGLKSISGNAFENCSKLNRININVTDPSVWSTNLGYLPDRKRYLYQDGIEITDLALQEGITKLENAVFKNCINLKSLSLPESLTSISSSMFQGCANLTSVKFPSTLTSIGDNVFYGCSGLTSLVLPDNLKSIGNSAFYGCTGLSSITIPNSVTIGRGAFENVSPKEIIINYCNPAVWSGNFDYLPKNCPRHIYQNGTEVTDLVLSEGIKSIGTYTFYKCSNLTSISLPNGITSIGDKAFSYCSSLTSISLPNDISSIQYRAFEDVSLQEIIINYSNPTVWGDKFGDLPKNCPRHIYQNGAEVTDLVLSEGLTSIGSNVFYNCSSLNSITLPDGLSSIGNNAFYGCSNLVIINSKATTPPSVNQSGVLYDRFTIFVPYESLEFYKNAEVWTDYAVHIISNNVETVFDVATVAKENSSGLHHAIGEENLQNVLNLKVNGTINSYDILLIRNKMLNLKSLDLSEAVIVPSQFAYLESYCTAENEIGPYMFSGHNLVSINLPKNIKVIGEGAFNNCQALRDIEINGPLEEIGSSAFTGTKCIATLRIKEVGTIRRSAFASSTIDSLIIDKVSIIEESACSGMSGNYVEIKPAKNVNIPLPSGTFASGTVKEVVLGKGFTKIEGNAFSARWSSTAVLQKVQLPEGITEIGTSAFKDNKLLKSISFPSSLVYLGQNAFEGCTSLKEIRLPYLTKLESEAFNNCTGLKEVKLPSSLETIGDGAFANCDSIASVYTYTLEPISIGTSTFSQKCFQNATLYVPETSYYTYYFNTEWSQFQHLKQFSDTYDYFYLDKDYLIDDETGTVKGRPNADLNSESGLIVQAKKDVQTLGNVVMDQMNDGTSASIIAEADNIEIDTLTVQLKVEAGKWIFYTPTMDVKISDCHYPGQYVWYDYDGAQRAASGTGWTKLSADTDMLEAGHGYILQSDVAGTVTLHYIEPTFGEDVEVNLETHDSENVADANWNLTGNPYTSYYDLVDDDYDAPIITWNVKHQTYEAYRPGDDDCHLQPGQAFFVQKVTETAAVTFSTERRETYTESQVTAAAQVKARRAKGINPRRSLINLTLSSDYTEADRTRVVLNEEATLGYDMGADASKFISTNAKAQLFTSDDRGSRYSINERPVGDVSLGYIAKEDGILTISAPRMDRKMMLLDRETNMTHDLSASDYNFNTKAGTFTNRFVLYMPSVPTDVAKLTEQTGVALGTQTGGISVGNAEGKTISVYTLGGQLMGNHTGNGFIGLPHGVYVVKVEKATAKITVK